VTCIAFRGRSMSREELDTISANALIKEHDDEAYWKGLPIIGHAELGTIRFTHRLPEVEGRAGSARLSPRGPKCGKSITEVLRILNVMYDVEYQAVREHLTKATVAGHLTQYLGSLAVERRLRSDRSSGLGRCDAGKKRDIICAAPWLYEKPS